MNDKGTAPQLQVRADINAASEPSVGRILFKLQQDVPSRRKLLALAKKVDGVAGAVFRDNGHTLELKIAPYHCTTAMGKNVVRAVTVALGLRLVGNVVDLTE